MINHYFQTSDKTLLKSLAWSAKGLQGLLTISRKVAVRDEINHVESLSCLSKQEQNGTRGWQQRNQAPKYHASTTAYITPTVMGKCPYPNTCSVTSPARNLRRFLPKYPSITNNTVTCSKPNNLACSKLGGIHESELFGFRSVPASALVSGL